MTRHILSLALVLGPIGSVDGIRAARSAEGAATRLGTFHCDVTPPIGSKLWYGENEPAKFVLDPQEARGVVLMPQGQDPIVLCAVDWCGIGNGGWDAWREALARAAGTSPERVTVHTLHQHTGMNCDFDSEAILEQLGAGGQQFNVAFAREAIARTAEAVADAVRDARPVTRIGHGMGKVDKVASNIRMYTPDGTLRGLRLSSMTDDSPFAGEPEGLTDPWVRTVVFSNEAEPVAVLTYYATHPQSFYGDGRVSAEVPGVARRLRQEATGIFHVHFNGAGGNLTVGKYNDKQRGPANQLVFARRLAEGMERGWTDAQRTTAPLAPEAIRWTVEPIPFVPRATLNAEKLQRDLQLNPRGYDAIRRADELAWLRRLESGPGNVLSCLHAGPVDILHMPGELYVEYQLAAQGMRPDRFVCMAAYGDYGPVYIGTAMNMEQGGGNLLDVWMRTAPESETIIRESMARSLEAEPSPRVPSDPPADAGAYVRAVLADGPTAYFRFGESVAADGARDASGRNVPPGRWYGNCSLGEPGAIAGDPDTCVRLDRSAAGHCVFGVDSLAPIAIGDTFTVEVWAKATGPAFTNLCWFASQRTANGFILGPSADGREWSAYVCDAAGQHQMIDRHRPPQETDLGQWHHYAFTYDGGTDTGIMYFDGEPVATKKQTVLMYGKKRPPRSFINLTVGRDHRQPGGDRSGDGWLDELAIYDHPLPADRIRSHHRLGKGP